MNEDLIRGIVKDEIEKQLMSSSNMVVPRHMHNGVDSPRLVMKYLINDPAGLIFSSSIGQYNITTFDNSNSLTQDLFISSAIEGAGNLYIGGNKRFSIVHILTTDDIENQVNDGTNFSAANLSVDKVQYLTDHPNFVVNFPDVNPLPASPVAGDFTFSAGSFYGCKVNGAWTLII